jgi:hypothetical protein
MSQLKTPQAFVRRFDAVRSRMLQVQVARALVRALLITLAGLALLAALDYLWEVPRLVRQAGLYGLSSGALLLTAYWIVAAVRYSNRPRTAFEIEEHFPELGQSVRTAVQFGGRSEDSVAASGVRSSLVEALEDRIDAETRPLPIEAVIPTGRLKIAAAVAAAAVLVMAALYIGDPQWKTAGRRALLDEQSYTQLSVSPGDTRVEQGKDVTIGIELSGRTARQVTLLTRSADDSAADWREQQLSEEHQVNSERGKLRYEVLLPKIKEPFVYRVTAGRVASDEYHVGLAYPLHLEKVEVVMTPPEYTRAEPSTTVDGNISALEGTHAVFHFELDRAPQSARVVLADPRDVIAARKNKEDELPPEVVPVAIDGNVLTMEMDVTQDKVYALQAESADGMRLPENSFRIRVRKDQPPQVFFDEPREALEVHTLAELLMRIRVRDDFGLTNAGIVFQVNNEEEHVLLRKDFEEALAEAAEQAADGKRPPPATQAVLDKILPLEHFDLKEQDSVTYYAFAEDNFPGGVHRSETDLRFVDIRPFRRIYKLIDTPDGMGQPVRTPASLGELIARQRVALIQAVRLARRPESAQSDVGTVDRVIEFEQKLAAATRESAEFFAQLNVAGNDLLFQAEEAMLAAVDSLTAGKYDNAVLQEKDALRYLIEGRRTIETDLPKKPPKVQAQVRAFDRTMTQKLRKPKNEEDAEEVASRLRELASEEEFVYETLTGLKMDDDAPGQDSGGGSGKPRKKPDQPPDPKDAEGKKGEVPKGEPDSADADKDEAPGAGGEKGTGTGSKPGEKVKNQAPGAQQDAAEADQEGAGSDDERKPAGTSRQELIQKQADIAAEAADIQRVMEKINGMTDLAKARIAEALKQAEKGAGALERGESKEAAEAAEKASGMFRELARNVEALGAAETAQKIAMARNISEELSQSERDLAAELERSQEAGGAGDQPPKKGEKPKDGQGPKPSEDSEKPKGAGGTGNEKDKDKGPGSSGRGEETADDDQAGGGGRRTEKLANRAGRVAEAGKTLEDVLRAVAGSNDPADKEAARQVQELMQQGKLGETVKRLEAQAPAVRAGKVREAAGEAREMADRFEVTSQKLEGLHRSIVAPRIAELMELERNASELQEKLDRLETDAQVTNWHRAADELLEQLDKMGVADEPREELYDAMKDAGWTADRIGGSWNWTVVRGYYGAPVVYHRTVRNIVSDLHAVIQELILGDMRNMGEETTPAQYERLVERYYQVLSTDK